MNTLTGQLIRVDAIDIPPEYERKSSLVEDDALRRSIEASGIQQPVVVFSKGDDRYALIDGGRRIEIAKHLGLHTVPAVIDQLPEGVDPREYQDRLRFLLDTHRQDLFPSQRAFLIKKLKAAYNMTNRDVASYLGVDASSLTGWLAIDNYHPSIVRRIDAGEINLYQSRLFDGMKLDAQPKVYRALETNFATMAGGKLHKIARAKFNPRTHPELYVSPEHTSEKLARKIKGRKSRRRPHLSRDEKEMLAKDLDLKEVELADGKEELLRLKREITAATMPVRAIMRSKTLRELIPSETLEELERFAEIYV